MRKNIYINDNLRARLLAESKKLGFSESKVIAIALSQYFLLQTAFDLLPKETQASIDKLGDIVGPIFVAKFLDDDTKNVKCDLDKKS